MDFGALPPETNSGLMYAGPGAGPMLASAVAWDALGAELHRTAGAYAATIEGLTVGSWQGPTAIAMAAAVGPYVSWISATASRADLAATQARLAASAYEAAFTATVPPPVIAANRAQLVALVATNIFGQNTPAIAATEAQYLEMWAQDAAAMYAYAGSSATAAQLTPFTEPPQTTNTAGVAAQAAAVSQAAGSSAVADTAAQLSQLISSVPNALQNLASTAAAAPATGPASPLAAAMLPPMATAPLPSQIATDVANWNTLMGTLTGPFSVQGWSSIPSGLFLSVGQMYAYAQNGQALQAFFSPPQPVHGALAPIADAISPSLTSASPLGGVTSGAMGRAALIGSLSVPQAWTTAAPALKTVAATLSTSLAAVPAASTSGELGMFGQMGMSGLLGRALGAAAAGSGGSTAAAASLGGVVAEADPAAAMIFVLPPLED